MIFPLCKAVGVNDGFLRKGHPATGVVYCDTRYMLVFDGPARCEVYEVESVPLEDSVYLRTITAVRLLSGADRTLVYGTPVDLCDRAGLVRKACELCRDGVDAVVFEGEDRHVTFVCQPSLAELAVIDVYDTVPPEPPKLAGCLRKLEAAGLFCEAMAVFDYHVTDLRQYEDAARTTVFPCRVPGLHGLFLNCLDTEPGGEVRLVGCGKTRKIFRERFPMKRFENVDICPLSSARPSRPFLLRCCMSGRAGPVEIGGVPGMAIRWSASPPEVYRAASELLETIRLKRIYTPPAAAKPQPGMRTPRRRSAGVKP